MASSAGRTRTSSRWRRRWPASGRTPRSRCSLARTGGRRPPHGCTTPCGPPEVAGALERGEPPAQVKRRLRMPSRAADGLIADARRRGVERLRYDIEEIADLELASRGGGPVAAGEDSAGLRALQRMAG